MFPHKHTHAHTRTHTHTHTHTHTPCFSELVCYIAERSSKQSPQRHSALLPESSSKSCPWSGEVGGQQVASDCWFKEMCFVLRSINRHPRSHVVVTPYLSAMLVEIFSVVEPLWLWSICWPHLMIRCELSKSHLMIPIRLKPTGAVH